MGGFFYWDPVCHCDRRCILKSPGIIDRYGRLDEVFREFCPVCSFLLCNPLWSGKNIPYRIFRFLARIKKKEFLQGNTICVRSVLGIIRNYSLNVVFRIEWIFMIPVHDLQV